MSRHQYIKPMRTSFTFAAAAAILVAQGCAIQSVPSGQVAASEAALAAAERDGAAIAAPADLARARDKLELTRRWMSAGDYKPARWLAEQAEVDAELARIRALGAFTGTN